MASCGSLLLLCSALGRARVARLGHGLVASWILIWKVRACRIVIGYAGITWCKSGVLSIEFDFVSGVLATIIMARCCSCLVTLAVIVAVVVSSPLGTRAENGQPHRTQAAAVLETAAAAASEELHEVDDEAALVRLANGSTWAVLGSTKYELPSAQLVAALGYSFEDAFLATPADLASLRESGERVQVV